MRVNIGRHELLLPINQTMTKFEKETRHRLYFFIKKNINSTVYETTARAHNAFCPLTQA